MAFRFVRSAGLVAEPAVVQLYASGTVHAGGVVEFTRLAGTTAQGFISPAQVGAVGTGSSGTSIFGVSMDGAAGNSDTIVRVIPFAPGQIWEADCVNAISTVQIGKHHQLNTDLLLNNTSYDNTSVVGLFFCWNVVGATTGSGRVQGEFIRDYGHTPQNGNTWFS